MDSSFTKTNILDIFVTRGDVITSTAQYFFPTAITNTTTLNWKYTYGEDDNTKEILVLLLNNKSNKC